MGGSTGNMSGYGGSMGGGYGSSMGGGYGSYGGSIIPSQTPAAPQRQQKGGQRSSFQPTFGGQNPWQTQPVNHFGMPGASQSNPTARPAQRGTGRYNDMAYGGAFGNNHYGNYFDRTAQQPGSYPEQPAQQPEQQQPQWTNPFSAYGGSFGVGLDQPNIAAAQQTRQSQGLNPISVFPGAWGGSPGMSDWQQAQRMNMAGAAAPQAAAPQAATGSTFGWQNNSANRLSPSQGMQGGRPQFNARDQRLRQFGWNR